MKKVILFSLIVNIWLFSFSQERIQIADSLRNISQKVTFINSIDEVVDVNIVSNPYVSNCRVIVGEDIIGTTSYDLQSITSLSNRFHVYPDGTIGAVWTRGIEGAPGFSGRGTGYNFFDGYVWSDIPATRVEDERTGWPSYAPLGENGEIIVAHLDDGLKLSTRQQKGQGDWTYQTLISPAQTRLVWPRMITAGENNTSIHLLVNSYTPYEGQERAMLYYRSVDGGASWDIEAEIIEGTGSDYYSQINTDNYVWAEPRDGVIAFLVASTWYNDLFMMKSTDNGDTWEKTVIWEHPYPFFDWGVITDEFYAVDNSASITLDFEGNAHVVFGITKAINVGSWNNFFPYTDGIGYWNETMPTFSNNLNALSPYSDDPESELIENYSLVGWTQDIDGDGEINFLDDLMSYRQLGISTMPSISVDEYGRAVLVFTSTTEYYDNTIYNYKHIWLRYKDPYGNWSSFEDLNLGINHLFDECVFPVIDHSINLEYPLINIFYQADSMPGLALNDDHAYIENRMIIGQWENIEGINEDEITKFSVSQNTPNPANNSTSIIVETKKVGIINLRISNLLGQVVHNESVNNNASIHTFNVNVNDFNSGIYFYTINIGNNTVTKKMLVK
ncbi:MAG: T9SS type A sorting domain-containing protein [Candidatus Tenebribacter mawsonii]|nr:T9SS type A sorting domain-containing protein [Candidatus Tenebribacter mawsonii]